MVPPDNNTVTSGNSQSITFNNIFQNPVQGPLVFTSTINSELGDRDVQTFTKALTCVTLFSPSVSLTLSSLYCDSLSDLTIGVSQDPGEADMSDVLFTSNSGSFAISSMNVGDTIGSASMTAGGGFVNYSTVLLVSSVVSSSQAIVESIDLSSGLSLGTFTLNNTGSGVSIYEVVPPDLSLIHI